MNTPFSLPVAQSAEQPIFTTKNIDELFAMDLQTLFNFEPIPNAALSLPATPPFGPEQSGPPALPAFTLAEKQVSKTDSQDSTDSTNLDDKKSTKGSAKKAVVPKVAPPPNEPVHPLFEAFKLGSLLNPCKDVEELLMTLSIEQLKYMEGVLSRIKKRKNYHIKRGNSLEPSIPFNSTNSVAEPEIPLCLTLPSANIREPPSLESKFLSSETTTPGLSSSGTSPSSSQTITHGVVDNTTENILIKDNNQIWMSFKSKDSGEVYEVHAEIDITKPEPTDLTPEFKSANSIYPQASTDAEKQKNVLGWWLSYLNPQVLGNNVPLLSQAADTFLVTFPGMFTATCDDALPSHSLSPTDMPGMNSSIVVSVHSGGISKSIFLRSDIEKVDLNLIDEDFKKANCIFPRTYERAKRARADEPITESKRSRQKVETICNEWAWKLAYLNPIELAGNLPQLQSALDTYRNTFSSITTRPHRPITAQPGSFSSDFSLDLTNLMLNPGLAQLLPQ